MLLVIGITAWNIVFSQVPTPKGYSRYTDYGISFVYPSDLTPWQVAIYDDGSVVQDGSRTVSENWGFVGWNSGNTEFERPGREGYYQETGVFWLGNTVSVDGASLNMYYNMQEATNLIRNRECNLTVGYSGYLTHRGHTVMYDFFNYTVCDMGEINKVVVYGIVGGFYCDKSDKYIELYYLDIYDFDPEYEKEAIFDAFTFLIECLQCH